MWPRNIGAESVQLRRLRSPRRRNAPFRVPISNATEPVTGCDEVVFLDCGIGVRPCKGLLDCLQGLAQFLQLGGKEIEMLVTLGLIVLEFP